MGKKFIEIIKNKWLKNITLTVVLFTLIICVFIAVNYGIRLLNITDLDFTEDKIYSISQATKDKLQNLSQNVKITVYGMSEYVNDFAYKYANLNKNIEVELLENLTAKTEWKTDYGLTDTTPFIMIESGEKEKILYEYNLYTYDYTTYEEINLTEEAMTNGILDVITEVKPKICFVTGHNLYDDTYFQYLQETLIAEANEVEFIDLLKTGGVPEDCKVLVFTALKDDITEKEKDSVLKYIKQGGELLLLLDPNLNQIDTPNFQKVLDEYGVSVSNGLILEGDSDRRISGAPNFVISPVNSSSEIAKNVNMELNTCMPNVGKLSFVSEEKLEEKNIVLEEIQTVSDEAFYRSDLTSASTSKIESDEDASGEVISAMLSKKIDEENTSKLIVFANTVFATNMEIKLDTQYYAYAIHLYNNEDIVLNSISYLTGREDNITIRKNEEVVTTYDVNELQIHVVSIIIFAIPFFIIILGIVIWMLRRRKK